MSSELKELTTCSRHANKLVKTDILRDQYPELVINSDLVTATPVYARHTDVHSCVHFTVV